MTALAKEHRLLWTLRVRGETSVHLRVSHGPPLEHRGGETVWKALFTEAEMDDAESFLVSQGLSVEKMRQGRQEIRDEQPDPLLTATLSDFDPSQMVYRTAECPQCYYFHPQTPKQCGVDDWPPEVMKASLQLDKAVSDLRRCTEHRSPDGE
jgi:hypothetical protein